MHLQMDWNLVIPKLFYSAHVGVHAVECYWQGRLTTAPVSDHSNRIIFYAVLGLQSKEFIGVHVVDQQNEMKES